MVRRSKLERIRDGDAGQGKGARNAGRPSDAFKEAMMTLVNRPGVMSRLQELLVSDDDRVFLEAYKFASDRGYGRASAQEQESGSSRQLVVRFVEE